MDELRQIAPAPEQALHRPDEHWGVFGSDGAVLASCSLWWRTVPNLPGQRLGLIGHYAASDDSAAAQLLTAAQDTLRQCGCTLAVGPMDGNTWQRYRLLTERGSEPAFFLEPDNPDAWPEHFTTQGFLSLAQYYSALNTDLSRQDERVAERWRYLALLGITIRAFDAGRFEEELRAIYRVSVVAFTQNFLYTPVSEAEFVAHYQKVRPYLRPELILMAEREGRLVGYMFALPNIATQPVRTVILKTVAVLPERTSAGLGAVLVDRTQQVARELGYTRAIHALMHETNRSRNISRHTAAPFRRYTLFAKSLVP